MFKKDFYRMYATTIMAIKLCYPVEAQVFSDKIQQRHPLFIHDMGKSEDLLVESKTN